MNELPYPTDVSEERPAQAYPSAMSLSVANLDMDVAKFLWPANYKDIERLEKDLAELKSMLTELRTLLEAVLKMLNTTPTVTGTGGDA